MGFFKTVIGSACAEITEKRSRFIANIAHVENEQEAIEFINSLKSKYWDARHNVFAYVISENNIVRFSDDGEPHSTAGKPVLDVLLGNNLKDTVIVVTRYFGGVLLGTGGLVRAYSSSAALAVESAEIGENRECVFAELEASYTAFDKLKFLLDEMGAVILNTDFADNIKLEFYVLTEKYDVLEQKITDTFFGKIKPLITKKDFCLVKA